jgi:hypothetical protein
MLQRTCLFLARFGLAWKNSPLTLSLRGGSTLA